MQTWGRSVYGLQITGLDHVPELGGPSDGRDPDLIPVEVRQSTETPPPPRALDGDGGVLPLADGRSLQVQRKAGRAAFYGPPLSTDQLAHPYLGPIAVIFNRWSGREVFHAAGFVAGGAAWIVLGRRTAGKSTLTAALAAAGVPILADDIMITDGQIAYAGPRNVDLREALPTGVLAHFGTEWSRQPMVRSRLGTRLRIALPSVEPRWPVGGWIFLNWGERTSVESVPISGLLGRLAAWRSESRLPSDPARLLAMASLPAFDLYRERNFDALPATVDLLLDTATNASNACQAAR